MLWILTPETKLSLSLHPRNKSSEGRTALIICQIRLSDTESPAYLASVNRKKSKGRKKKQAKTCQRSPTQTPMLEMEGSHAWRQTNMIEEINSTEGEGISTHWPSVQFSTTCVKKKKSPGLRALALKVFRKSLQNYSGKEPVFRILKFSWHKEMCWEYHIPFYIIPIY